MELVFAIPVIILMFFHWVGDFVFQSRYMAENKSRKVNVLILHSIIYSLTMALGMYFLIPSLYILTAYWINFSVLKLIMAVLLIFVFHALTDGITSRLTSRYYSSGNNKKFWSTIGFDQWLHLIQIIIIFYFIFL